MKTGSVNIGKAWADNPLWLGQTFTHGMAWLDLLLNTEDEEQTKYVRGISFTVKRGQVALSQNDLAMRWKWSRGKVIRFLAELEKQQQIKTTVSNVISLITIVDYNSYSK